MCNYLCLSTYQETVETGHHRFETRQVFAVPVSQLPPLHRQSQWLGLTTVVMVKRRRQLWNKTTTEVCFYISSLAAVAARHNHVIRSHWSIENSLHWGGVSRVNASKSSSQITPNWLKKLQFIPTLSLTILQNLSNICRCWYWSSWRHSPLVGRHLPALDKLCSF